MDNLANILTVARLALLPFIVLLLFFDAAWTAWTALALYLAGAATDWLDGWVARAFNQVSDFGRLMDPISDKVFVMTILMMLVADGRIQGVLVLAVIVILIREFIVAGLREFLGPRNIVLPVTRLAKWKTTVQMVAAGFLIMAPVSFRAEVAGQLLLCAAAVMTAVTGWDYIRTAWRHIGPRS